MSTTHNRYSRLIGRWARPTHRTPSTSKASGWTAAASALSLLAQLMVWPLSAVAQTTYGEEAKTRLQLSERIAPLTEDSAFGEQIGQFNGSVNFRYVDVSLPGNDGLKVEFARVSNNEYSPNFWGWDIDIPKITSVLPEDWEDGWTADPPDEVYNQNGTEFMKKDYWNGFRFRIDGQTTTLLRKHNDARVPPVPFSSQHVFMTKSGWVFESVPATGRPGESLVGIAPNGLKYYFDHLVTDTYDTVDWLIQQVPGNNGRVGLQGISYPGFFAAAGLVAYLMMLVPVAGVIAAPIITSVAATLVMYELSDLHILGKEALGPAEGTVE